jgi:GNAT superfamily N-acetyltransferase
MTSVGGFGIDALPGPEIERLREFVAGLPAPVDSYVEDHILGASHYALNAGDARFGSVAVSGDATLVHFVVDPDQSVHGRSVFDAVCRRLAIERVLVPTSDEWLLVHALDRRREVHLQAALFRDAGRLGPPANVNPAFNLRPADPGDVNALRGAAGDFLGPSEYDRLQLSGGLFVGRHHEAIVSLGVLEAPRLLPGHASIGMFTMPERRRQGFAVDTLLELKKVCRERQWAAVAGCAYGNTGSWRALERAGMVAGTRLLRIDLAKTES